MHSRWRRFFTVSRGGQLRLKDERTCEKFGLAFPVQKWHVRLSELPVGTSEQNKGRTPT